MRNRVLLEGVLQAIRWPLCIRLWLGLLAMLMSPHVLAIHRIHIEVGQIDAPAGQLQNAIFQVDLNADQPKLKLNAELKPAHETRFSHFSLNCGQFNTEKIGYVDCLDGAFRSPNITAPFSVHFESRPGDFSLNIVFRGAQFSDVSGLHAGEGLTGYIKLNAKNYPLRDQTDIWHWNGVVNWTEGELFWQPFYFGQAGNTFKFNGTFTQPILWVQNASLAVNSVGIVNASGQMNTETHEIEAVSVSAKDVDFAGLYEVFLKPMAEKSAFGNMRVSGRADWLFEMKNFTPSRFQLDVRNANIRDNHGKFDLQNLNARIPWDYDQTEQLALSYESGHILNMPLAKTAIAAEVNRFSLTTPKISLPVLDGALNLYDVSAARIGLNWVWHLRLDVAPITMNEFSKALNWPSMTGKIAGEVPLVTYANQQLRMNGQMRFTAFKGHVSMDNLTIDDPLGVVPVLSADLALRDLDMGDVTRTFSFGAIEGKLEGDVKNLRLENWKPVWMDFSLFTRDGPHLKKISQRAVENIAAFGGQGTAETLQRLFLRFFDAFNYEKIGFSCRLRGDICEMGGVEPTANGYVIVKGSGVPSVNVNGFTQRVSLSDLLDRIKRITDTNIQPLVE